MNDESKENVEKTEAEQQEYLEKKQQEQQAIEDAENLQDEENLQLFNQEIDQAQQNQLNQEQADQQEQSPTVPSWMRDVVRLVFLYESEFGQLGEEERQDAVNGVENALSFLENTNTIKSFEETLNGFTTAIENEGRLIFNLKENNVFTNSVSDKAFDTISSVVKAVGGDSLDISPLKDSKARYSAFKSAQENSLEIKGLSAQEEDDFKQRIGLGRSG